MLNVVVNLACHVGSDGELVPTGDISLTLLWIPRLRHYCGFSKISLRSVPTVRAIFVNIMDGTRSL